MYTIPGKTVYILIRLGTAPSMFSSQFEENPYLGKEYTK